MDRRIVEAARQYAEKHLQAGVLYAIEVEDGGLPIGEGRESWLVRVEGAGRQLIVAIEVHPDGHAEAVHHVNVTRAA